MLSLSTPSLSASRMDSVTTRCLLSGTSAAVRTLLAAMRAPFFGKGPRQIVHRTSIVQRTTYSVPNGGRGPQKEVPVESPQQRPQDAGEGEVRVADATEEGRMRAIVQRSYGSPEVLESA